MRKEGAHYCIVCGQPLNTANRRRPRIRPGCILWVLIIGLIGFLGCAWSIYQGLSYYPEPDSTATAVQHRNLEAKQYMLELVNQARTEEDAPPVTLGANKAAQLHAEQGVEECTSSHWDKYGLKPYMRYSLTGGSNHNGENIATYFSCVDRETAGPFSWSLLFDHDINKAVEESVEGLLDSPGHRDTMLDPNYSIMNAGIAWDKQSFNIVQLFETDLIEFTEGPELREGILTMKGSTKGIPDFGDKHNLRIIILYDPPPVRLRPNQLVRTSCYGPGEPFLAILEQPPKGRTYTKDYVAIEEEMEICPDPYRISRKVRTPSSIEDVERLGERAKESAAREREVTFKIDLIEAGVWQTEGSDFRIMADISDHMENPGVYSLLMFTSEENGDGFTIGEKSFFHEVAPPRYYTRGTRVEE